MGKHVYPIILHYNLCPCVSLFATFCSVVKMASNHVAGAPSNADSSKVISKYLFHCLFISILDCYTSE